MQLESFNAFRRAAQQQGVIFYYSGYFSQSIVAAMGDTLKHKLAVTEAKAPIARKVFSTFIEMAQNIMHYSASDVKTEDEAGFQMRHGSVAVGVENKKYFVVCGNRVERGYAEGLKERVEKIRQMSVEEIKQAYRVQLRGKTEAGSKGAGLGLLTMARDVTEPVQYTFDEGLVEAGNDIYFYLKAII